MKTIIFFIAVMAMSSYSALYARDLDGSLSNGHEGVYDDVLDITWLADANLASSNNFSLPEIFGGLMGWDNAQNFITAINADNSGGGYLGVNTWRLPSLVPVNGVNFDTLFTYDGSTDVGYQLNAPIDALYNPRGQSPGSISSELAYQYAVNFGAVGRCSGIGISNTYGCAPDNVFGLDDAVNQANKMLFSNTLSTWYWTGTVSTVGATDAFAFDYWFGQQTLRAKNNALNVWIVADGDIGVALVPIPAAIWLFGSSLFGLLGLRVRNRSLHNMSN